MDAIMPAFRRLSPFGMLTSTEYTRLLGSADGEIDVTWPLKSPDYRVGGDCLGAAQPNVLHRGIGNAEDGFDRAHVRDGETVRRRANQLPFVNVSLNDPAIKRRTQFAIGKRDLRLATLAFELSNRGLRVEHLRLALS